MQDGTHATNTHAGTAPANLLRALRFTRLDNAAVDLGTQTTVARTYLASLPATSVTFIVRRVTAGQRTTVAFSATDGCGDWPTITGGGSTAF